jgi:hydroxypyruvate reductase
MLLEVARSIGGHDLLVVLLSGGGSALLAAPEQALRLEDIQGTTGLLLKAGAPIGDINTVRRQLLAAAGGGLGRAAYPAPVTTLILSDVIGNPVHDIASGPTVPSPSTPDDALSVLERHSIRDSAPRAVVEHLNLARNLTTDDSWTAANRVEIIGDNRTAVEGAAVWLAEHGYAVEVVAASVVGEASVRGREIAAAAEESGTPSAVVFGGETTVTVRGSGRGGRNQEVALAAAIEIEGHEGLVLLAGGTDGVDGGSENAGAVVDGSTAIKLRRSGIDPQTILDNNDSGTALEAVGDAFRTGPTGTNVCDLTLVLSAPTTEETKG